MDRKHSCLQCIPLSAAIPLGLATEHWSGAMMGSGQHAEAMPKGPLIKSEVYRLSNVSKSIPSVAGRGWRHAPIAGARPYSLTNEDKDVYLRYRYLPCLVLRKHLESTLGDIALRQPKAHITWFGKDAIVNAYSKNEGFWLDEKGYILAFANKGPRFLFSANLLRRRQRKSTTTNVFSKRPNKSLHL